ncbi:hypothetical protein CRG98_038919 [Punica granatum]|uniref:Uncharacterized protein n=1 Tax=Punica granatum TaxID=22663 RepID=A0A2I0I9H9_PUNGR|nr:hypothetical protein CRG98_038919 [Punica granatum]
MAPLASSARSLARFPSLSLSGLLWPSALFFLERASTIPGSNRRPISPARSRFFSPTDPRHSLAQNPSISSSPFPRFSAIKLENPSLENSKQNLARKKLKIPLDPDCPKLRDAHPEHGVAQAVPAAVSRALSRHRRGA